MKMDLEHGKFDHLMQGASNLGDQSSDDLGIFVLVGGRN
jgi:hypothetical protein